MTPLLEAASVSVHFGDVLALQDVTLALYPSTVHAVLGENGAGKSTLMKVIAGAHQPTSGKLMLRGSPVRWDNAKQARDAGISTIFQEFILLDNLSVAENLFLGRELCNFLGMIDREQMRKRCNEVLERLQLRVNLDTLAGKLSVGEQQMVEIARGLMSDATVFVFDEPTAALGGRESERLFEVIRELRSQGKGILYISHRLSEIFSLCDEVTVLKDGSRTGTFDVASVTPAQLITAMVGRRLEQLYPERSSAPPKPQQALLEFDSVATQRLKGPIDLIVNGHEIVGLAGLEGQGQMEITRTLFEGRPLTHGAIRFRGSPITPRTTAQAIDMGIGLLPEDRKSEGLFHQLGIASNIQMGLLSGLAMWRWAPQATSTIEEQAHRLSIRMQNLQQPIGLLSGGNQQKALLARWLVRNVKLLVCEEPTRGVDIGAKAEIYALLRSLADAGVPSLVVSRELPELIGLCDRIVVLHEGCTVDMLHAESATEEAILHSAVTGNPTCAC